MAAHRTTKPRKISISIDNANHRRADRKKHNSGWKAQFYFSAPACAHIIARISKVNPSSGFFAARKFCKNFQSV